MWILDDRNKSIQAKISVDYTTTPISFINFYNKTLTFGD